MPIATKASRKDSAIHLATGIFAGFALLAAVNVVAIAALVPLPSGGVSLRLAEHAFDVSETLGVGSLVAMAVGGWVGFAPLPRWVLVGVALAAGVALVHRLLGDYLIVKAAYVFEGRFPTATFVNSLVISALLLVGAPLAVPLCARRRALRFGLVAVAIALLVADQIVLRDDYMDIHGYVALLAALLAGPAFAPRLTRLGRTLTQSRAGRGGIAALGVFALFGIVVPPANATRIELFRQPCALAPWVLATTLWGPPRLHAPTPVPPSLWLEDRSGAPAIPKAAPPLLPEGAVVVLITIDALRADIIADPANDARFPTFAKLKRDGVVFTHASAPGTQTTLSVSTLFSGLYYSEQVWKDYGPKQYAHPYPAADPFVRFPQLLSDHDVATVNDASLAFLAGDYGLTRGFREERVLGSEASAAPGLAVIHALADRLDRADAGPLFLWTHLMDAHAPYGRRRRGLTDYQRYLLSVASDDALLGRVLAVLEERFGQRWALFVSADHGEAFGEHGTFEHAKTLYEELLHVPLLARSPLFPPREVTERVGLIDLGPTFLDLFGVAIPATFNGESLVPLLAGGHVALTRPLLAEGRLRQALTQSDGLKVIEDRRRKIVEVYDLASDPRETRNLFDVEKERSDGALAQLRAFFAVHTRHDGGYVPPYRP